MNSGLKILLGLIFILIGLGLFVDEIFPFIGIGIKWLSNFIIVITGIIPPFLIILGLFIVWLEIDEIKAEKELKEEEEKEKRKKKPASKK